MKKAILAFLILLPLSAQPQKKTESFWDMLLRIAGVSATPGALRGTDKIASGDVWLAAVARETRPPAPHSGRRIQLARL